MAVGSGISLVGASLWVHDVVGNRRSGATIATRQEPSISRTASSLGAFQANELSGSGALSRPDVWALRGPSVPSLRRPDPPDDPARWSFPDGLSGVFVLVQIGQAGPQWMLTNAGTGLELLEALDVVLAPTDIVRPSGASLLTHGATLQVIRIRTKRVTLTEDLPYATVTRFTSSMAAGAVKVLQEGVPGQVVRNYSIRYRNGRVSRRVLLSETVLTKPVPRIVEQGTAYSAPPVSGGAAAAVAAAYTAIGVPYVNGGASLSGFDCSGLTMWAWGHGGVSLSHSVAAQYSETRRVSRSDLRPGDLLFFYSGITHVAIYVGGGQMIMAHTTGTYVQLDPLSSYWWGVYQGAGRPG